MVETLLISFAILLLLGAPVGFAVMGSSFLYFIVGSITGAGPSVVTAAQKIMTGIDSFPLMAIPFFVLAGEFMNTGGITKNLMAAAKSAVGHIRGGIAQVVILASAMFAAMSGSSIACTYIFGKMMIPIMEKDGYDKGFASAIVSCSATVGPIIPPSISVILYAVMAGCSAGQLLISGVIPGIIMAGSMMFVTYLVAIKRKYPTYERPSLEERRESYKNAFLPLLMPVILIGGIVSGVFTATEAAVVSVTYAAILGISTGMFRMPHFLKISFDTFLGIGRTMFIIASCTLFGWIMTYEGITKAIETFLRSVTDSSIVVLLLVNVVLLILGMFMESGAIIVMITPILAPIVKAFGIDPIHFGMMVVINTMIGGVSPPVGLLMYISNDIAGVTMNEYLKHAWPLYIALVGSLLLVTFIPPLATWLPGLLMG